MRWPLSDVRRWGLETPALLPSFWPRLLAARTIPSSKRRSSRPQGWWLLSLVGDRPGRRSLRAILRGYEPAGTTAPSSSAHTNDSAGGGNVVEAAYTGEVRRGFDHFGLFGRLALDLDHGLAEGLDGLFRLGLGG